MRSANALAERDGLLPVIQRRQLAEAINPGRALAERILADARLHALEVVAHDEHLPAPRADGQQPLRVLTVAADRALDVADETHRAPWNRRVQRTRLSVSQA